MKGRKAMIFGVHMDVVEPDEAEQADFVLCATEGTPTPFDDNVVTQCAGCGCNVIHRPYAPKTPPKVCMACAVDFMKAKDGKLN